LAQPKDITNVDKLFSSLAFGALLHPSHLGSNLGEPHYCKSKVLWPIFQPNFLKIATEFSDCDRKQSVGKTVVQIYFVTDWQSFGKISDRQIGQKNFRPNLWLIFSVRKPLSQACDRWKIFRPNLWPTFWSQRLEIVGKKPKYFILW